MSFASPVDLLALLVVFAIFGSATETFAQKNLNRSLDEQFTMFEPTVRRAREHGLDVVDSIRALRDGKAKVFVAMGGNFVSAAPDTVVTEEIRYGDNDRLAALVRQHDLTVCSDEIHCDLVLDPAAQHIVFATLGEDIAARTVTLMAASKTFNIAGLTCGFAIIPDAGLRTRFRRIIQGLSLDQNVFGLAATQAAFEHGEPWRLECVEYLRGNLDLIEQELKSMPGVVLRQRPQASFLVWFDITALGFDDAHAEFEKGGIGFSNGTDFGGPGHVRLNFGCPRERLREILRRMKLVVARAPGRVK